MRNVFMLVEKKNKLAVHGIFDSQDDAKHHLEKVIPFYVERDYFMDKTLRADSFEIVKRKIRPDQYW